MPKLWTDTIDAHRQAVVEAALDAAGELVISGTSERLTMSAVAEKAGIGRPTLYRYFPDIGAVIAAWHARQVRQHLAALFEIRQTSGAPGERLARVLRAYAEMLRAQHGVAAGPSLHEAAHVAHARQHLDMFLRELLAEGAAAGTVRTDMPIAELSRFCLAALASAADLPSAAATERLTRLVLDGIGPRS